MSTSEPFSGAEHVSARRQETRNRLLDAGAEVFTEFGLQGSSVERICSRADFSRGAFYSNFSTKEELFMALLEREYERRAEHIRGRATDLLTHLRGCTTGLTPEDASHFVTEFMCVTGDETMWFALETEFMLLTLRDPHGPIKYVEFSALFREELSNVVEELIQAAGRRFTIPVGAALTVLEGVFDRALRTTALYGADADEGLDGIGDRYAELLFALTEEIPSGA